MLIRSIFQKTMVLTLALSLFCDRSLLGIERPLLHSFAKTLTFTESAFAPRASASARYYLGHLSSTIRSAAELVHWGLQTPLFQNDDQEKQALLKQFTELGVTVKGWQSTPVKHLAYTYQLLETLKTNLYSDKPLPLETIRFVPWYRNLFFLFGVAGHYHAVSESIRITVVPFWRSFVWVLVHEIGHAVLEHQPLLLDELTEPTHLRTYDRRWRSLSGSIVELLISYGLAVSLFYRPLSNLLWPIHEPIDLGMGHTLVILVSLLLGTGISLFSGGLVHQIVSAKLDYMAVSRLNRNKPWALITAYSSVSPDEAGAELIASYLAYPHEFKNKAMQHPGIQKIYERLNTTILKDFSFDSTRFPSRTTFRQAITYVTLMYIMVGAVLAPDSILLDITLTVMKVGAWGLMLSWTLGNPSPLFLQKTLPATILRYFPEAPKRVMRQLTASSLSIFQEMQKIATPITLVLLLSILTPFSQHIKTVGYIAMAGAERFSEIMNPFETSQTTSESHGNLSSEINRPSIGEFLNGIAKSLLRRQESPAKQTNQKAPSYTVTRIDPTLPLPRFPGTPNTRVEIPWVTIASQKPTQQEPWMMEYVINNDPLNAPKTIRTSNPFSDIPTAEAAKQNEFVTLYITLNPFLLKSLLEGDRLRLIMTSEGGRVSVALTGQFSATLESSAWLSPNENYTDIQLKPVGNWLQERLKVALRKNETVWLFIHNAPSIHQEPAFRFRIDEIRVVKKNPAFGTTLQSAPLTTALLMMLFFPSISPTILMLGGITATLVSFYMASIQIGASRSIQRMASFLKSA